MKKQIKKNINQRLFFSDFEKNRLVLKSVTQNIQVKKQIRWKLQLKFNRLPFNSSLTRISNICILTGRSHSVYRFMKYSRIQLRKWASLGILPGITKRSW